MSPSGHLIQTQCDAVVELFVELLQVRVAIVDRSKELPPDMTEVRPRPDCRDCGSGFRAVTLWTAARSCRRTSPSCNGAWRPESRVQ
jgi:hypothetical protein